MFRLNFLIKFRKSAIVKYENIKEKINRFYFMKLLKWLILMTNDWRLANFLMHPRYEHSKEYIVETFWSITDEQLDNMSKGLLILWSYTKESIIKRISSGTFSIILTEWKNRQIRRMVEKVWSRVKRLKRIRIENINLWKLDFWEYKHLSKGELAELFETLWIKKD